ncbi:hypothetical protein CDAR_527451 [Caerostris darwini]|uniref:Uncharacterized protein n=1 Tax=Caerostris darwini TaxID=1538125 RepID=A0AAV4WKX2_9ARAC|nr:hypothetical protein CDAR_527451 [Caerostris darwini]
MFYGLNSDENVQLTGNVANKMQEKEKKKKKTDTENGNDYKIKEQFAKDTRDILKDKRSEVTLKSQSIFWPGPNYAYALTLDGPKDGMTIKQGRGQKRA